MNQRNTSSSNLESNVGLARKKQEHARLQSSSPLASSILYFSKMLRRFYCEELYRSIRQFQRGYILSTFLVCAKPLLMVFYSSSGVWRDLIQADSNLQFLEKQGILDFQKDEDLMLSFRQFFIVLNALILAYIFFIFIRFSIISKRSKRLQTQVQQQLNYEHLFEESLNEKRGQIGGTFSCIMSVYSYIFFIPSIFSSIQDLSSILSLINILLSFIINAILSDCEYSLEINSEEKIRRRYSYAQQVFSSVFEMPWIFVIGLVNTNQSMIICLIYLLTNTAVHIFSSPYYESKIQFAYLSANFFASSISLIIEISVSFSVRSQVSTLLILLAFPFTYVLARNYINYRENHLQSLFEDTLTEKRITMQDLDEIMRMNLFDEIQNNRLNAMRQIRELNSIIQYKGSFTTNKQESTSSSGTTPFEELIMERIRVILHEAIKKELSHVKRSHQVSFPVAELAIYYIFLLQIADSQRLYWMLYEQTLIQNSISLKQRQILYTIHRIFVQNRSMLRKSIGGASTFDCCYIEVIIFEQQLTHSYNIFDKAIMDKVQILNLMKQKFIDSSKLIELISSLQASCSRVKQDFHLLSSLNSSSSDLLHLEALYLQNLAFTEKDISKSWLNMRGDAIKRKRIFATPSSIHDDHDSQSQRQDRFDENTCVVFASFNDSKSLTIKKVSINFKDVFIFTQNADIIGHKIESLMPQFVSHSHSMNLSKFFHEKVTFISGEGAPSTTNADSQSSRSTSSSMRKCQMNEDGLTFASLGGIIIQPVHMDVRVNRIPSSDMFGLTAKIKKVNKDWDYIIFDEFNLSIQGLTFRAQETFLKETSNRKSLARVFPFLAPRIPKNSQQLFNQQFSVPLLSPDSMMSPLSPQTTTAPQQQQQQQQQPPLIHQNISKPMEQALLSDPAIIVSNNVSKSESRKIGYLAILPIDESATASAQLNAVKSQVSKSNKSSLPSFQSLRRQIAKQGAETPCLQYNFIYFEFSIIPIRFSHMKTYSSCLEISLIRVLNPMTCAKLILSHLKSPQKKLIYDKIIPQSEFEALILDLDAKAAFEGSTVLERQTQFEQEYHLLLHSQKLMPPTHQMQAFYQNQNNNQFALKQNKDQLTSQQQNDEQAYALLQHPSINQSITKKYKDPNQQIINELAEEENIEQRENFNQFDKSSMLAVVGEQQHSHHKLDYRTPSMTSSKQTGIVAQVSTAIPNFNNDYSQLNMQTSLNNQRDLLLAAKTENLNNNNINTINETLIQDKQYSLQDSFVQQQQQQRFAQSSQLLLIEEDTTKGFLPFEAKENLQVNRTFNGSMQSLLSPGVFDQSKTFIGNNNNNNNNKSQQKEEMVTEIKLFSPHYSPSHGIEFPLFSGKNAIPPTTTLQSPTKAYFNQNTSNSLLFMRDSETKFDIKNNDPIPILRTRYGTQGTTGIAGNTFFTQFNSNNNIMPELSSGIQNEFLGDSKKLAARRQFEDIQLDIASSASKDSSCASAKRQLCSIMADKSTVKIIKGINIIGVMCFFTMFAVTLIQYYELTASLESQHEDYKVFEWPTEYQSTLSLIFKNQNALYMTNDNYLWFPSIEQKYIFRNRTQLNLVYGKDKVRELIAIMERAPTERKIFQLLMENYFVFQIGKQYNNSVISGTSSIPSQLVVAEYNATIHMATILAFQHVYRYSVGVGKGRPEYYMIQNQLLQISNLKTVQNLMLDLQIEESNSLQSDLTALMSIIISVAAVCIGIIIPLYYNIQKQRDIIISLFATFPTHKIDAMLKGIHSSYYSVSNNYAVPSQTGKRNQQLIFFSNSASDKDLRKQNISTISSLPRFNSRLTLIILVVFILVICYPVANKVITSEYLDKASLDLQTMIEVYQLRSFMLENIAMHYNIITMKYYPKLKPQSATIYYPYLQQLLDRFEEFNTKIDWLIQEQYSSTRYQQSLYDQFFFPVIKENICSTFQQFPQYNTNSTVINSVTCPTLNEGFLLRGLQISYKKFLYAFPDLFRIYQVQDAASSLSQLTAHLATFKLEDFTLFQETLEESIMSLKEFILKLNSEYFDYIMLIQTVLIVYQISLMILVFLIGWLSFSSFLNSLMHQTKSYLKILDINSLIDNSYILTYIKKNSSI